MGTAFLTAQTKEMGDMLLQVGRQLHIPFTLTASAGTISWSGDGNTTYRITNSATANITVTSTSKIDLTRFSVLRYYFPGGSVGTPIIGFATTNTFSVTAGDYAVSIATEYGGGEGAFGTLDVSALNGEYYFKFCAGPLTAQNLIGPYYLVLEV